MSQPTTLEAITSIAQTILRNQYNEPFALERADIAEAVERVRELIDCSDDTRDAAIDEICRRWLIKS